MSITQVDDVLSMWIGEDKPTDRELVGLWVKRAERMVMREVPGLQAAFAPEAEGNETLQWTVRDVVSAMVTRVLRNPEGIRTIQDSTGGVFSGSTTYAGDNPGMLYIDEREKSALMRELGGQSGGFWEADTLTRLYSG